ncbi:response regulator [Marinibaculum pumilum]|uniref:Response regulator n=1 Tax=Marinibaculum pumilum TaxID=1766165 RepID=A0ABV7L3F7_9PROT
MATILMADDDEDDRLLACEAMGEAGLSHDLRFVADGQELVDYLTRGGAYAPPAAAPRPAIVLLDVNMPRMNGWEALVSIRRHPELKGLPVVMMTTAWTDRDVRRCYELGANSFIQKPGSFGELVRILENVDRYWFGTVSLPGA